MSIKKKLSLFVCLSIFVILLICATGGLNFRSIERSEELKAALNETAKKVEGNRIVEKSYLQFHTDTLRQQFQETAQGVLGAIETLQAGHLEDGSAKQIEQIRKDFGLYQNSFNEITSVYKNHQDLKQKMTLPLENSLEHLKLMSQKLDERQSELQIEGEDLSQGEMALVNVIRDCRIVFLQLQNFQNQFQATGDTLYIDKFKELSDGNVQIYISSLIELSNSMNDEQLSKSSAEIKSSLGVFLGFIGQSIAYGQEQNGLVRQLDTTGIGIIETLEQVLKTANVSIRSKKNTAVTIVLSVVGIAVIGFTILSVVMIRSITQSIQKIVSVIKVGTDKVAGAAFEIEGSSQSLSEGAAKQAASLEETSSALEEMASMTKCNADNAGQADQFMNDTNQVVRSTNDSMRQLITSMDDISKASEETAKIIKAIDEIAFQTNLLALNAAVEAARAGEAGKGFAVVAEEVRNLAMRSASAADNTSSLIEGTTKKVNSGSDLVSQANKAFTNVDESANKVGALLSEIAEASKEQSMGIDQLNSSVASIDNVTQQFASEIQKFTDSSGMMSRQAQNMKQAVEQLDVLVGGNTVHEATGGSHWKTLLTLGRKRETV